MEVSLVAKSNSESKFRGTLGRGQLLMRYF